MGGWGCGEEGGGREEGCGEGGRRPQTMEFFGIFVFNVYCELLIRAMRRKALRKYNNVFKGQLMVCTLLSV